MIVGLLLMFAGYWSEAVIPTSAVWSPEQAAEYQKASAEMHGASYAKGHDHSKEHSHDEPDRSAPEYVKAKAAFEKSRTELDRAVSRRSWLKYGIIFVGVAISGYGIVLVALDKMRVDEEATQRRPRGSR